jgi:hypothetical protein
MVANAPVRAPMVIHPAILNLGFIFNFPQNTRVSGQPDWLPIPEIKLPHERHAAWDYMPDSLQRYTYLIEKLLIFYIYVICGGASMQADAKVL